MSAPRVRSSISRLSGCSNSLDSSATADRNALNTWISLLETTGSLVRIRAQPALRATVGCVHAAQAHTQAPSGVGSGERSADATGRAACVQRSSSTNGPTRVPVSAPFRRMPSLGVQQRSRRPPASRSTGAIDLRRSDLRYDRRNIRLNRLSGRGKLSAGAPALIPSAAEVRR